MAKAVVKRIRRAPTKKKRRYSKRKTTIPLTLLVASGVVGNNLYLGFKRSNYDVGRLSTYALRNFTGFDYDQKKFDFSWLKHGAFPLLGALVAHKVANKVGINRMLAHNKIPYIRI